MILYKYCAPERVDILESGKIGLTRPRSFNDPFELSPNISSVSDGMEMSRQTWNRTKDYAALCFAESADDPLLWGQLPRRSKRLRHRVRLGSGDPRRLVRHTSIWESRIHEISPDEVDNR